MIVLGNRYGYHIDHYRAIVSPAETQFVTIMKLFRTDSPGVNLVQSVNSGEFIVNDVLYTRSIIVSADIVVDDWAPQTILELTNEDFRLLAGFDAEIVILGTGRELHFPDIILLQPLIDQKCGYEIMDTSAACRTYNVLVGDGRKVVAALLADRNQ